MSGPKRIQLSRRKGWTKPPGAVVVSRPSKWGNPWTVGDGYTQEQCAELFDTWTRLRRYPHPGWVDLVASYPSDEEIRAELAGKDLCCWCGLDEACHVETLLRVANTPVTSTVSQEVKR